MFCGDSFQAERDKLVFDIAPGKIAASIDGVKLILRADVEDEFSSVLNELETEVFVLNTDEEQRRIVGNS